MGTVERWMGENRENLCRLAGGEGRRENEKEEGKGNREPGGRERRMMVHVVMSVHRKGVG